MDKVQLALMFAQLAPRILNQVNQQGGFKNFPNILEAANRGYDIPNLQQSFDAIHSLEPNYAADIINTNLDEVDDTPRYAVHKNPSDGWASLNPNEAPQNLHALYDMVVNDYDAGIDMDNDTATFPALKSALRMLLNNKNIGR